MSTTDAVVHNTWKSIVFIYMSLSLNVCHGWTLTISKTTDSFTCPIKGLTRVYTRIASLPGTFLWNLPPSEQCLPTGSLCLYIYIYSDWDSGWNCFILLFYSAFVQWYARDGILGTRTIVSLAANSKASQEDEEGMGTAFPWLHHMPQKPLLGQN